MNTKSRNFSVCWTVASGPDRSHMIDVRVFDRLRSATAAFDSMPDRPRQLWRHTWLHPYSTDGDKRLVREASPTPPDPGHEQVSDWSQE